MLNFDYIAVCIQPAPTLKTNLHLEVHHHPLSILQEDEEARQDFCNLSLLAAVGNPSLVVRAHYALDFLAVNDKYKVNFMLLEGMYW